MFSKVKQFFGKRKPAKKSGTYLTAESVSLKDLCGKKIVLEIKTNGNDSMLLIKDKSDTQQIFTLDRDCALLLIVLLQSYSLHGVFPDLEEKED